MNRVRGKRRFSEQEMEYGFSWMRSLWFILFFEYSICRGPSPLKWNFEIVHASKCKSKMNTVSPSTCWASYIKYTYTQASTNTFDVDSYTCQMNKIIFYRMGNHVVPLLLAVVDCCCHRCLTSNVTQTKEVKCIWHIYFTENASTHTHTRRGFWVNSK